MSTMESTQVDQRAFGWSDLLSPAAFIALAWTLSQIAFAIWPQIDTLAQRGLRHLVRLFRHGELVEDNNLRRRRLQRR